jgi:hypothetical protein
MKVWNRIWGIKWSWLVILVVEHYIQESYQSPMTPN